MTKIKYQNVIIEILKFPALKIEEHMLSTGMFTDHFSQIKWWIFICFGPIYTIYGLAVTQVVKLH